MEDRRAHIPEAVGSNPAPATLILYIKEVKEMVLAAIRKQFKMIQNRIQFCFNMKNWITFGALIRLRGLCIV